MTAEKNYGLSDDLIESARAVLAKSSGTLDEEVQIDNHGKNYVKQNEWGDITHHIVHKDALKKHEYPVVQTGGYGDTHHFTVTSKTGEKTYHHVYQRDFDKKSGNAVVSIRSIGRNAPTKLHAKHAALIAKHLGATSSMNEETLDEGRGYKAHELDAAGYKHVNHVNSGQTSTTMYRHPDGHEIHVERGNNSKKYSFYSGKPGASSQVYHANLKDAIKKNGHLVEETIDEGRGRPRKTPLAAGEEEGNEPDQNIIMQMRKVQSLRGAKPVSFRDGSKHTVHMADALKAIRMHSMMRTSIEKGNFEAKIAKSHADFKHHIGSTIKDGGSEEEKKAKVTLPGVDRLRAKGKLDEEFRPNQKVKFKHTDGSWKEGRVEDREVYGVVSGQGPTKHNPNDHSTKAWGHMVSYDMDGKGKRGRGFVAKTNIKLHEEEQIDEAKPDFHYQEWPGQKPKKAFNLSKYLENSDKRLARGIALDKKAAAAKRAAARAKAKPKTS